jgi:hypothetical protein
MYEDSIKLQRELIESQGIDTERIKPYTGSSRFGKDVESLYKIGMTCEDVAYSLSVPLEYVRRQRARILKAAEERRKFLISGIIPTPEYEGTPGVFTIYQR